MAVTLEDISKLPDQPTPEHLLALGLIKPPPELMPPSVNVRVPMAAANASPGIAGSHVAPMTPAKSAAAPEAPDAIMKAAVPPTDAAGSFVPEAAPQLGYKERMALPTISQAVHPGTSQYYENQLERIADQKAHPWGSEENHPGILGKIGHVAAKIGNTALDVLAPATAALIPGTDLYNRQHEATLQNEFAGAKRAEGEEANRQSEAQLRDIQGKNLQSEIEQRENSQKQELVQDAQGNVTGWKDKSGLHSLDEPNTPQAIKDIAANTTGKNQPEAMQPLGQDPATVNKQLENRYQVLHPGKPLPDEYKIPANATKGDYTRIDKALTSTENAEGTKAQRDQIAEMRRQTLAIQQQKHDVSQDAIEAAAKALAGGDLTRLKDIASMRGDQRLLIFNRAKELNPQFSPNTTDRMVKMVDEYTTGKIGDQLQSFGTFLEHAGAAKDAADQIYNSSVPAFNKPLNWWKEHLEGDPAYQRFVTSLEPVRKEFEGFLLGGRALYGDDRKNAEIILNNNSSPAQINAALKQMGHTVEARYNELDHRFQNTVHKSINDVIGPPSNEALEGANKIGVKLGAPEKKEEKKEAPTAAPASAEPPSPPDPGMKWQRNKTTGEFRQVPEKK